MQADTYRLIVRRGPQPNQVFELKEDVVTLGRDITNTITINDREVSRHHMRLIRGAEGFTVEDLGSTNGTFVNGKRVSGATLLRNGDMLSLGETVTLSYELLRADAPGAPRPATPPPQAAAPDPYKPPAAAPSPAPQPYNPPAAAAPSPAPQPYNPPAPQPAPYASPAQQPYGQQPGAYSPQPEPYQAGYPQPAGQDQGYYAGGAYGAPPPPGYDYDPYAMREEEGRSSGRIVLFGCLFLMLFCCCITVIAVVAVDTLNLYCQIPGLRNVLEALGLLRCAVGV